jgi:hypothetical protein
MRILVVKEEEKTQFGQTHWADIVIVIDKEGGGKVIKDRGGNPHDHVVRQV